MQVRLNIIGVGYKASIVHYKTGLNSIPDSLRTYLQLNVGNSHPHFIPIPKLLNVSVIETAGATAGSAILITEKLSADNKANNKANGVNANAKSAKLTALLTNFAAMVSRIPKKDVYKGKGLRYDNSPIKLKVVNKK